MDMTSSVCKLSRSFTILVNYPWLSLVIISNLFKRSAIHSSDRRLGQAEVSDWNILVTHWLQSITDLQQVLTMIGMLAVSLQGRHSKQARNSRKMEFWTARIINVLLFRFSSISMLLTSWTRLLLQQLSLWLFLWCHPCWNLDRKKKP